MIIIYYYAVVVVDFVLVLVLFAVIEFTNVICFVISFNLLFYGKCMFILWQVVMTLVHDPSSS